MMKIEKQYDEMKMMFDEYDEFIHFKNVCQIVKKMNVEFTNDELLKIFYDTFECDNDVIENEIKKSYAYKLIEKQNLQTIEQKQLFEQIMLYDNIEQMNECIELYEYKKMLFVEIYEILIDEYEQNIIDDLFDELMYDVKFKIFAHQMKKTNECLNEIKYDNLNNYLIHQIDEMKNELQNELFEQTYIYVTNTYLI